MRLKIKHITEYSYSSEVFVEPQYFYMYPCQRPHIKILEYQIDVSPTPSGISLRQDAEGNFYHQCWFNDMLEKVHITMNMEIEAQHINPFDFLIENQKSELDDKPLQIYLSEKVNLPQEMHDWIAQTKEKTGDNLITILSTLCSEIGAEWDHTIRYEEHLLHPSECYTTKQGSCRDLAWMLIQILRHSDIPARFVSGYANNPELDEGHELHAWVEVWLNGPGWVGLDPTSGLFTTEHYVPVAASYLPKLTLPVQGSFRGQANSSLWTKVEITEYD